MIFGHFWNCKKWNLAKKNFFLKLIYLISQVFLAWTFLNFLANCATTTSDPPPKKTEFQWCDGLGLVIICTGLGYLGIGYTYFVRNTLRNSKAFVLLVNKLASCFQNKAVQILIYIMVILSVGIFLVLDTYNDRRRLISASGVIILVLICTLASKHPRKINWRQVLHMFFVFLNVKKF